MNEWQLLYARKMILCLVNAGLEMICRNANDATTNYRCNSAIKMLSLVMANPPAPLQTSRRKGDILTISISMGSVGV